MRQNNYSRRLQLLVASQLAAWPSLTLAQQAAPASKTKPAASGVEEVIVTAQRRSERLERTPVAVTALSSETLRKRNITTEADLQFAAPGLIVRAGLTSNEVNYSLRGQSLDQYSSTTPGVLPYINEVQLSTNTGGGSGATAFYDLQSIQVLKGPQGTLFGRDATAGAVLFTTTKPGNSFGGYISGLVGNYDTEQAEGAINIPIVDDKLLTRFAGFFGHQEGFQTNLYDDSHPGSGERQGFRGSVTFKPTSDITDDLMVDYYHSQGSSEQAVLYNIQDLPGAEPVPLLYSPLVDFILGAPGLWQHYLATHPNPTVNPQGFAAFLASQEARGPFLSATNSPSPYTATNIVVTNNFAYDINDETKFKNIFGFGSLRSFVQGDSDGTPYGVSNNSYTDPGSPSDGSRGNTTIFSDESQITGTAFNQNLKYTTGFYYSTVKAYLLLKSQFFDILGNVPSLNNDIKQNTTYGVYAQGTYDLSSATGISGLSVTGGLRYNNETAERLALPADQGYGLQAINPTLYQNHQSANFGNIGWTFGAQEQLNSDLLLYAVTRRSYKDGGFNAFQLPQIGFSATGGDEYKTEAVTDVEVGSKYQGILYDVPTRLNIAIYQNWINNSQRAAFASIDGNPSSITVNVPEQQDFGVEFDGQVRPLHWLTIGGSLNYTDAQFTSQGVDAFGVTQNFATVPDTPKWSGTVFAEIAAPINDELTATVRGEDYAQTGTYYSSSGNLNPGAKFAGYGIANFRFGLDDARSGWSLSANLKNAFNKTYYVGGTGIAQLLDYNTALPGAPRTFTIQVQRKF
jgi:iron complex outermembrane receptor protein